ncbi:hypothetical protein GF314_03635 [bacterium]|nr:hypothetical protein [bacterium]
MPTPCPRVPFGQANEILPLPDGSAWFPFMAGGNRVDILRVIDAGPQTEPEFSQVVRPSCSSELAGLAPVL